MGFVAAACAAIVVAAAGTAAAEPLSPRHFSTYAGRMAAGNQLAQRGEIHNYTFVEHRSGPLTGSIHWDLIIYS